MAQHEDRRRITSRVNVLQACLVVTFTVLAFCFWVLQVIQHDKFNEMAATGRTPTQEQIDQTVKLFHAENFERFRKWE